MFLPKLVPHWTNCTQGYPPLDPQVLCEKALLVNWLLESHFTRLHSISQSCKSCRAPGLGSTAAGYISSVRPVMALSTLTGNRARLFRLPCQGKLVIFQNKDKQLLKRKSISNEK